MDMKTMDMKTNGSSVWPYVVLGSAIGGAVGYLVMTESGRKIGHSLTHPDELANDIEGARDFIQRKARVVTDQVHGVLNKAKSSIEAGERAYRDAEISFQGQVNEVFQDKSDEFASNVHKTVDTVKSSAVTIEKSVLDPIVELGALVKGVERGIRTLLGKDAGVAGIGSGANDRQQTQTPGPVPTPIYRDRMMGS